MSDYTRDFGDLAQELVKEFGEELGEATLKSYAGKVYDPTAGQNVPAYTDHLTLMVFDEIETEEDGDYIKEHQLAIIAGQDVPVEPKRGDLIVKQSGTTHKVMFVIADQYNAAFNCHIQRKPS